MDLLREFRAVRAVGTPIVAVRTSNQPDTIQALLKGVEDAPAVRWDTVGGLKPLNDAGSAAISKAAGSDFDPTFTQDPVTSLELLTRMPEASVAFLVNAHRFIEDARVSTGIGNLREPFKAAGSTCVLLGPSFRFPVELMPDVVILEDPLPDDTKLSAIIDFVFEQARANAGDAADDKIEPLDDQRRKDAVSALRGLSSFGAEQQAFLSLRRNGGGKLTLDMKSLWQRKIEAINSMPGLAMEYGQAAPDAISGLSALMSTLTRLFRPENPERPGAVLHIDEIDKALAGFGRAGSAGDSSGVTQDQVGQILQYMEDKGWDGLIPVGPPGCLHGDTPIYDPLDGTTKTVAQREALGVSFHVWALGEDGPVIARAERPWRYEPAPMVSIRFASGRTISVTPGHRFWAGDVHGFVAASELIHSLLSESVFVHPHSSLDSVPSSQPQDGLRSNRTAQDSQGRCSLDSRLGDVQPHVESDSAPGAPPSPAGALLRRLASSPRGGMVDTDTSIDPPDAARHANTDCTALAVPLPGAAAVHQHHEAQPAAGSCSSSSPRQHATAVTLPSTIEQLRLRALPSIDLHRLEELSASSVPMYHPCGSYYTTDRIVSAVSIPEQPYYDFHVPRFENYWACGFFHHNTGKSLVSKSAAGLYGVPYIRLDLGGLKGSLVGESEQRIRAALETIDRLAAGRVFVMATCNRLESLPPELKRRFTAGIWYFDLPDTSDRADLWALYIKKYGLSEKAPTTLKDDWSVNWTGAEIRNVCRAAWRLGIGLEEARKLTVPVCESGKEDIERLRAYASGRFLDAARGGPYRGLALAKEASAPKRRLEGV